MVSQMHMMTYAEIGKVMGLDTSYVSKIEKSALRKLKRLIAPAMREELMQIIMSLSDRESRSLVG